MELKQTTTTTASRTSPIKQRFYEQVRVVQRPDNAIHRINHYPVDSVVCFVNTYQTNRARTIAVHVRYKSLYISLPSSAKQELEMTKFFVVLGTRTTTVEFSYILLELNAVIAYFA